jgi:ABC-type branched-subunit amino acid transport system permease subunit
VGWVFGGMASVWGAVAGGLLLQFWSDIAGMESRDLVHASFGALLVLSMRFMPNASPEWCRRGNV